MHAYRSVTILSAIMALFALGYFIGCSEEDDNPTDVDPTDTTGYHALSEASCAGCHTNEAMLKATVEEDSDDTPPSSGEG